MEVAGGGFGEGFPDKPCTVDEILNPDFIDNELINAAAPNQPAPNEENVVAAPPVVNEQPFVDEPEPNNPAEPPCEQAGPSNAEGKGKMHADDAPTFNLGFSQDIWEDVMNVVDEIESTTKDKNKGDAEEIEKNVEKGNEVQIKGKTKMHTEEDVQMKGQVKEKNIYIMLATHV
ncbi:hypothetical protein C2S53_019098 [Perilla frutescens var. hirtella]|uniref:Uncharacterized protein n=1 Tax=Perilla frutescens var. hirtella TaxID=608512 RepID=A0AAD4J110_PERFH|nr:hypothetical protein C2S53_019098 [Perilla frutescens var. hirtella]